ncbi:hypothetical protein NO559_12770 [Dasania sp. GY-MA-18]|uniref:Uncharacterized protein n=1 Tax=Dasania phycosphaerae TaxID=2950436 RepID=A0A9J6RNH4_9GAMM|nr:MULTISPECIES: hypothetical protein [Dasania]MCR8923649.1 hypothetical protein [Dasania sp. GY-MA-18]MCZ0866083.1 hypothetical protein [Dasania phycosphaerae]MCZ0869807.1 hypothetical protein [Dasania phycosphaerae]
MPDPIATQINTMQTMAKAGHSMAEILGYLTKDQGIEQQLVLMERCRDAFGCHLGEVTAIGAWWHDGSCELNDEAINAYIGYIASDYAAGITTSEG